MDIVDLKFKADISDLDKTEKKLDAVGKKSVEAGSRADLLKEKLSGVGTVGGPIGNVADKVNDLKDRATGAVGSVGLLAAGALALGAAAVTAAAGILRLAMDTAELLDKFTDLEARTNVSTRRLQFLGEVAIRGGIALEDITGSAEKLASKLAKQDEESGKAAEGLKALGIATKDANGEVKSALTLQEEVIRATAEATDKTRAEAAAVQVLGTDYYKLRGALSATVEQKTELYNRLRDTGALMSGAGKKAVAEYGDQIDNLKSSFLGIKTTIVEAILPTLNSWLDKLNEILRRTAIAFRKTFNPTQGDKLSGTIAEKYNEQDRDEAALKRIRDSNPNPDSPFAGTEMRRLEAAIAGRAKQIYALNRMLEAELAGEAQTARETVLGATGEGPRVVGKPTTLPKVTVTKDSTKKSAPFMHENGSYVDGRLARESAENHNQQTMVLFKYSEEVEKAAKAETDALMKKLGVVRDFVDPAAKYRQEMAEWVKLQEAGKVSSEQLAEATLYLEDQIAKATGTVKEQGEQLSIMERIGQTAFKGLEDSLMTFVSTGKLNFKGFVSSILLDLARLILQINVIQPMLSGFSKSFSSGGGGFGSLLGNIVGAFSGAPKLATGTNYVPYDGMPAILHEGEAVVPKRYNPAAGGAAASAAPNVTIQVTVQGGSDPEKTGQAVAGKVQELFVRGIVRQELQTQQRARAIAV